MTWNYDVIAFIEQFEEMMDRLEKGSGQTVVTLQEAKSLLKEDDDLIIAVYDYWLNKRLKTVSIVYCFTSFVKQMKDSGKLLYIH